MNMKLTVLKSDIPGLFRVEDSNGNPLIRDTTEDRARFIVHAVNGHDALVKALKTYLRAYPHNAPHDCFSTGPKTSDPVLNYCICPGCQADSQARAALKGDIT